LAPSVPAPTWDLPRSNSHNWIRLGGIHHRTFAAMIAVGEFFHVRHRTPQQTRRPTEVPMSCQRTCLARNAINGTSTQWFNPNFFLQPPPNSGFWGNATRNNLVGPGLVTWDFSAIKDTQLRERLTLQFRAEIFNLLNRANFNTPNLIVFTPSGVSGTAGAITSTSTTARQVQFGLKLVW
jgi:hypothetical protein